WCADELDLKHALAHGQPWFCGSAFLNFSGLFYRPLGYSAFAAQIAAAGGDARWIHAASIAHHLVNVGLCALLFRRLRAPARAARLRLCMRTAIEGVAGSAAISDRLVLTWLLAAALWLSASGPAALASLPFFLLALTTKESAVAFAPAALLLAWRRGAWPR